MNRTLANIAASAALVLGGCASLESIAPSVTPAMGSAAATLNEGRRIFTGPCAACHAPDPVASRPLAEWRIAVDRMAPRSKLDAAERAALLAYIAAAHGASAAAGR